MAEDAREIDLMEDAADLAAPEQIFRECFSPGADHNGSRRWSHDLSELRSYPYSGR